MNHPRFFLLPKESKKDNLIFFYCFKNKLSFLYIIKKTRVKQLIWKKIRNISKRILTTILLMIKNVIVSIITTKGVLMGLKKESVINVLKIFV